MLELIALETERARQNQPAEVLAKMNSLVDSQLIDALYDASAAGVQVRLNVRGIWCLRPGVKGLSENIEVVSIVDRYLEHARVYFFQHGGEPRVYISSADWMPRNLDRRVELLVPIENKEHRRRLEAMLRLYFTDNTKSSVLRSSGSYRRKKPRRNSEPIRAQEVLHRQACAAAQRASSARRALFEPHRAPGA